VLQQTSSILAKRLFLLFYPIALGSSEVLWTKQAGSYTFC